MKKSFYFLKLTCSFLIILIINSCETTDDLLDPLDSDYFVNFNRTNSGLPGNMVWDIYKDRSGLIWFACYGNGIGIYDGSEWSSITSSNSPIPTNNVKAILQDSDGDMWFGTSEGLYFLVDDSEWYYFLGEGTYPVNVNSLFMDSDYNVWIGTEGNGFYLYQYSDGNIYGPYDVSTEDNNVYDISEDDEGNIWFACDIGVWLFNGSQMLFTPYNDSYPPIHVVYPDNKGKMWIAADGGSSVIYYQDNSYNNIGLLNGQPNYFIRDIVEDFDGNIWFASFIDGLIKYDGIVMNSYKPYNGFPSESNFSLEVDSEGSVWIGTFENGVYKYIPPVKIK